mgnify:CR=1 FL=1
MRVFDYLDRYLVDDEYKITLTNNYLNIINYLEIMDFSNKEITIKHAHGLTIIKGNNLVVSKMMNDELLIKGEIKSILIK